MFKINLTSSIHSQRLGLPSNSDYTLDREKFF